MSTSIAMSPAAQTRQMMIAPREINDEKLPHRRATGSTND
jgi:hypothetical protein